MSGYNAADGGIARIPMQEGGISGSETREMIQKNIDESLDYFVPEEVSIEDRDQIKAILV